MALSGSYNFSQGKDSILKDAFRIAGIIDYSEDDEVDAEMITSATRTFNRMIKAWTADGLQVHKQEHVTLLLEKSKATYDLGATGDHWTLSYTETAISVAGIATDTTIECDSTTGMTAADYVGIVLDDGTIQWTTVSSVTDSDTFVIASGLTGATAIDNPVYFYTNKAQRPYRITEMTRRDSNNNDIEIRNVSREEYWNLANKTDQATVTQAFYDQSIPDGRLYVYNVPNTSTDSLEIIAHYPFQDMDSPTDNIDLPDYWYEAVIDGLAYRLSIEYASPKVGILKSVANDSKTKAMDFDVEDTSVFFQPEYRR